MGNPIGGYDGPLQFVQAMEDCIVCMSSTIHAPALLTYVLWVLSGHRRLFEDRRLSHGIGAKSRDIYQIHGFMIDVGILINTNRPDGDAAIPVS